MSRKPVFRGSIEPLGYSRFARRLLTARPELDAEFAAEGP
jgi:hypothetical protein